MGQLARILVVDLGQGGHPEPTFMCVFRCKDGYLPIMLLARAMGGRGLIAIRDAKPPQRKDWQPFPESGTSSTPAPSYLCGFPLQAIPENTHGPIRWLPSNWSLRPTP